jgi:hypothetical protein
VLSTILILIGLLALALIAWWVYSAIAGRPTISI